jgi:hypothetical protein
MKWGVLDSSFEFFTYAKTPAYPNSTEKVLSGEAYAQFENFFHGVPCM